MKTTLQTLFFFLLVTQICFGQWYQQNRLPQGNSLHAVKFVTPAVGWCVGDGGTILKTTDAGSSWHRQEIGTMNPLWDISFTDVYNGTVVGGGIIFRTTNGGLNWALQSTGDPVSGFTSVSFSDANIGTVIGLYWTIFRTTNGGANWIQQLYSNSGNSHGVSFASENNGLIVGRSYDGTNNHYGVARTTDGGANWAFVEIGITYELYYVYLSDTNNGTTVGDEGAVFRTTNGGISWISQISGTSNNLRSVCFIDSKNGYAVGANGTILKTNDGGTVWTTQSSNTTFDLTGVSFADVNNGIVVGDYGTILRTTNAGSNWIVVSSGPTNDWADIFFSSPNNGLVIGDAGTILKTSNGGTNWALVQNTFTNDIIAMCFTNANNGWLIGHLNADTSIILHTNDGGEIWAVNSICPVTILGISFIDTSVGYLAGYDPDGPFWPNAIILKTTDGGMNWTQSIFDSLRVPDRIQFIDANNGWMKWTITGNGGGPWGGMAKTTDEGTTWIQQLGDHYNDFQFWDINNGIAVARRHINNVKSSYSMEDAEWGIISKTTDGGDTWSSDSIYSPVWDVQYINNNTVVTLGKRFDDQVICYWSTDAGSTWNPKPTGIYEDMHHIFFIDEQNGWMIGNNGAIFHTTNGGVSFVEEEEIDEMPTEFLLSNNYPNPFNPSTKIKYSVPQSSKVILKVFDVLGNEIETLVSEEKPAGTYEVTWYAEHLPSGVYFYQLKAGEFINTKKMILIK